MPKPMLHRVHWLPTILVLAGCLGIRGFAAEKEGSLDLYWIDSEGGGSTLIVTPAGESVLIDSGNPGGRDAGRIHKLATTIAGLRQIDHLIVTHFHIDHFGGAAELAQHIPIIHIWDNGPPETDPDGRRASTWPLTSKPYREIAARERHVVQPGTVLPLQTGPTPLQLRCIISRQQPWKPEAVSRARMEDAPETRALDSSDNANSSAWLLSFGAFRFYDGGDLTWNTEASLVWPEILVPEVDLCQVTHHGLDASNHPALLRALNPTVTVMNNGPTKGAMAEVMQTLRSLPRLEAQYQLHRNVRPDGSTNNCPDAFIANPERNCHGHHIHCSVAPQGTEYTLLIPANEHTRTYSSREKAPANKPEKH
jgi:beta-lactamase superfamily II metal-dependent hydrolase